MKKIVTPTEKFGAYKVIEEHDDHLLADGIIFSRLVFPDMRIEEAKDDEFPQPVFKGEVPRTITKLQCMKQLKKIEKWEAFKALLEASPDANDEWILSDDINRNYPLTKQMGEALGLSEEELDDLFREAQYNV